MDYLSDKVNSLTGTALSNINELRRKRKQQQDSEPCPTADDNIIQLQSSAIGSRATATADQSAVNIMDEPSAKRRHLRRSNMLVPLSGGIPFGGDTNPDELAIAQYRLHHPPPIGFKLPQAAAPADTSTNSAPVQSGPQQPNLPLEDTSRVVIQKEPPIEPLTNAESSASLYDGDAWTRLWFQRVMILSFIRLLLFIRKVYEDYHATKLYNLTGQTGHFLISAATLFLPTIVFTIYRVSRYLQVTLPPLRAIKAIDSASSGPITPGERKGAQPAAGSGRNGDDDDDKQLRRALMNSPTSLSTTISQPTGEEDGLVTARQSPSNPDDLADSAAKPSNKEETKTKTSTSPVEGTHSPISEELQKVESVNVDKLGDIPDKETVRVVIGASEQILHGVMFIFWQLKRQVDVMAYLVERACLWRKPSEQEKDQMSRLRFGSDGLEWFQDFYAAFLAILAQVYTLGLHWANNDTQITPLRTATNTNSAAGALLESANIPDNTISNTARAISNTLMNQAALGDSLVGKDLLLTSQLLVSSAVVLSLLIAVKRRDDGPLTLGLSMIGWGCIFSARIMIIALAFVHIGWHIMLSLVVCHVLGITAWIYKIALDSHNNHPDENEASKWEISNEDTEMADVEAGQVSSGEQRPTARSARSYEITSRWSIVEHLVLLAQIMTLFALPSLFYWPIMFNLKLHYRPFKYLVLILSENFILIPVIWFKISSTASLGQWYLLGTVGGFSIVGFIFISLYVSCKPSLTEYFARADELFNEADQCGIYFEFCSRIFKMPDLSKHDFRRLMNQTETIEEN